MKDLITSHMYNMYLKPGEVFVSRKPALVSTVLGSCVAVTMFSAFSGFGAICHAMLPENAGRENDLRYVDTALQHIYEKIVRYGIGNDLVIKLFGGAQVLNVGDRDCTKPTVGEQNISKAESVLASLGLQISARDTGGMQGRKMYFCTQSGDVYMRRIRSGKHSYEGMTP